MSAVRPRRLVPALLVVAAVLTCNAPRLSLLDNAVTKGVVDTVSSGPRTRIDVLWVIDNSGSMCQEQANLIGSFRTFVTGLAELEADVQMAVVTTDMTDPGQQGKFQHHPATDFRSCTLSDPEKGVYYCLSDEDCGEGGCLCGLPHLLRCESDGDCPESLSCVTSGRGSQVRFCSAPCGQHSDCQTVLTEERTEAFWCAEPGEGGEAGAGKYCLLRVCEDDTFCPAESGYRCLPSAVPGDGGVSYCRQFVNRRIACTPGASSCPLGLACRDDRTCPWYAQCPAPTCDCPKRLDNVLTFRAGSGDEAELERAIRDFRCMATVGTGGEVIEKGLGAIRMALSSPLITSDHPGFPRDDAHLLIVILSDEDDCTGDEGFFPGSEAGCQERGNLQCVWCRDDLEDVVGIADFLRSRKRDPYTVAVAAIVGDEEDAVVVRPDAPKPSCSSNNGVAFAGHRYVTLAREFERTGVIESICSDSFEGPLERIASLVVSLSNRYCLSDPIKPCWSRAGCPEGSVCGWYWGDEGVCLSGGQFTGESCKRDSECTTAGARCDDRRVCLDGGGHPRHLEVWVQPEGATVGAELPRDAWSFVPDSSWGCVRFSADQEPGAGDSVYFRYTSTVQ